MKRSATPIGIILSLLDTVTDLKRTLQQSLKPKYQEKHVFRIQSQSGFDKEELQTVLKNELQGETTIESNLTNYFSEEHLGPTEIHDRYFMKNATTGTHNRNTAGATVEIILNDDWESGDDALKRLSDSLEQFGTVSVSKDAEVYR